MSSAASRSRATRAASRSAATPAQAGHRRPGQGQQRHRAGEVGDGGTALLHPPRTGPQSQARRHRRAGLREGRQPGQGTPLRHHGLDHGLLAAVEPVTLAAGLAEQVDGGQRAQPVPQFGGQHRLTPARRAHGGRGPARRSGQGRGSQRVSGQGHAAHRGQPRQ
ncbi:MAG: hypothetical protein H6932_04860 [Burkholderiaceae bacterium]|nr:hypothetical protein [Burkholderiaceae bacterium]